MRDAVPSCFSFRPSAAASDNALSKMELNWIAQVVTQHGKKSIAVSSLTPFLGGHCFCHGAVDGFAESGYLFCPLGKTMWVFCTP